MALATKCPHCNTVFRVAHDQLKLRGGIVRCGACNEIFDGNAALIEPALPPVPVSSPGPLDLELDLDPTAAALDEAAAEAPALTSENPETSESSGVRPFGSDPGSSLAPPPELEETGSYIDQETPADALRSSGVRPEGSDPGRPLPPSDRQDSDFDLPSEHIVAVALDDVHSFDERTSEPAAAPTDDDADADTATRIADDAAAADLLTSSPESALLAAGTGAVAAAPDDEDDEPEFIRQANRREHLGRNARVVMRWGTPLLAILLLVQLGTTFRNPLAARYPALQPALSALCAPFLCKVELPMQIDALAIEQGELQTLADATFSFATVLRNGSRTAQAWPHIELILNDAADKPVLRRVFAPRDYLANPAELKRGFGPRSEQPVKLYFELTRLKASGYHIAIFYP